MAKKMVSDEEFIRLFREHGSPDIVAKMTGVTPRSVYIRRDRLEKKYKLELKSFAAPQFSNNCVIIKKSTIEYTAKNQVIMIASDCHYWPGEVTVAHKAFVKLLKQIKPHAVILNGDVFDGARISRHDPLYRHETPTVKQELETCQQRLGEIEKAAHNAKLFWLYGNHDTRLWRYMRINSPEVEGAFGADLFDYFPGWHCGYVMHINKNTVVKHRWHNGVHATYNNVLKGGRSIVTGHLHRLQITSWGDYNGRRYGVDTGTLAEPTGDQFLYLEGNPTAWASGFAVLTFDANGMLLPPELCEVIGETAYFRGKAV